MHVCMYELTHANTYTDTFSKTHTHKCIQTHKSSKLFFQKLNNLWHGADGGTLYSSFAERDLKEKPFYESFIL